MGNLLTYQSKLPGKTFTLDHALQVMTEVMKGLKSLFDPKGTLNPGKIF